MKAINISPSFLMRVYSKGYDYAVGEKLGLFKKDTQPMSDGRLMHELLSAALGGEPAKFAISPYDSFRTNAAKEWRDSQPDNIVITTQEKIDALNKIVERVINHENIKPMLDGCKTEQTINKEVNGLNVKGIVDVISPYNGGTWIDWKFVASQVFDSFDKKALYMNYDIQSACYDFLTEVPHGYFVTIENEAPHRIKLFHCDTTFLDSGANKFDKAFKVLDKEKWREPNFDIKEVGELMSWENYAG